MHTFSRQVHWLQPVFWYELILRIGGIQILKVLWQANKGYIPVTIQATCSISNKRLQSSFCHIKDQHSNFFRFLDAANQIADIDGQSPFLFCNPHVANRGGRTCKLNSVDVMDGNSEGVFSVDGIWSWIAEKLVKTAGWAQQFKFLQIEWKYLT